MRERAWRTSRGRSTPLHALAIAALERIHLHTAPERSDWVKSALAIAVGLGSVRPCGALHDRLCTIELANCKLKCIPQSEVLHVHVPCDGISLTHRQLLVLLSTQRTPPTARPASTQQSLFHSPHDTQSTKPSRHSCSLRAFTLHDCIWDVALHPSCADSFAFVAVPVHVFFTAVATLVTVER